MLLQNLARDKREESVSFPFGLVDLRDPLLSLFILQVGIALDEVLVDGFDVGDASEVLELLDLPDLAQELHLLLELCAVVLLLDHELLAHLLQVVLHNLGIRHFVLVVNFFSEFYHVGGVDHAFVGSVADVSHSLVSDLSALGVWV